MIHFIRDNWEILLERVVKFTLISGGYLAMVGPIIILWWWGLLTIH